MLQLLFALHKILPYGYNFGLVWSLPMHTHPSVLLVHLKIGRRLTQFTSLKALRLTVQSFVSNRIEIAKRGVGPLVVTALRAWRAPRARPSPRSRRVGSRHRRRGASRVPQAASECSHVGLPSGYGHVAAARHHPE